MPRVKIHHAQIVIRFAYADAKRSLKNRNYERAQKQLPKVRSNLAAEEVTMTLQQIRVGG